jgi:hypothetical protein
MTLIHTWLQPGVGNEEIGRKPFKRFPIQRDLVTTRLKPGVNKRESKQLLTPGGNMNPLMKCLVNGLAVAMLIAFAMPAAFAEEDFSLKEYNEFHDVLRPLQHEALPAKDFQRIRSNSAELLKRGEAIVRVGVPKGMPKPRSEEFARGLKDFQDSLGKFGKHAKDGTDEQLGASFSAVHDSFEMLAGMLPRK